MAVSIPDIINKVSMNLLYLSCLYRKICIDRGHCAYMYNGNGEFIVRHIYKLDVNWFTGRNVPGLLKRYALTIFILQCQF